MNLTGRLNKVDVRIREHHKSKGEIVLYDEFGEQVEGRIASMPSIEKDGLAKLADGTEKPIVYESNWQRDRDGIWFVTNDGIQFDTEAPIGQEKPTLELKGKLFIRYSNCSIIIFETYKPKWRVNNHNEP